MARAVISLAPFRRYNLLSNWLPKWFDNRVNVCIHDTTGCRAGCQTGCIVSIRFDNRLYRVYKHLTSCQTRLTTGLITGCIVYTAGCQTSCTTRYDNWLNEQWLFVQHGCQTLTTGCIV